MSQLPFDQAINRLKDNEERLDGFVNGPGYTTSTGASIEGVPDFIERIEADINASSAISQTNAAKAAAQVAAASAVSAAGLAESSSIVAVAAKVEAVAAAAGLVTGVKGYATLALLNADLVPGAGVIAMVTNDPTPTNNGYYRKIGATTTGSWTVSTFDPLAATRNALLDYNLCKDNNSTFAGAGDWLLFGAPGVAISGGEMQVTFTAGVNQAVYLPPAVANLSADKQYQIEIRVKLVSGTASRFQFGSTYSSLPVPANQIIDKATATYRTLKKRVIGGSPVVGLWFGLAAADNLGCVMAIDDVKCFELSNVTIAAEDEILALQSSITGLLSTENSTMVEPNSWAKDLGNPGMSFTSNVGEMTLTFGAGTNQNVSIPGLLVIGQTYTITAEARLVSGNPSPLFLGDFSSLATAGTFQISPTSQKIRYVGKIVAQATYLSIGLVAANNAGCVIALDNLQLFSGILADIAITEEDSSTPVPLSNNTAGFMLSLSKYDKPLIKVGIVGDSLMANDYGGAVPGGVDEGLTRRPIRLDCNSVPRLIYDYLSFNKATHRRLDDADWTKSGTWTSFNDTTVWEPPHTFSAYHSSIAANAYAEIAVPNGNENFALIVHKDAAFGKLDILLNGGSIAAYGPSQIDLARVRNNASDIGNPFYTVLYTGLPAGVNTIRVRKENNATKVDVWGGFYWTGVTLVVHNVAHGGHTLDGLYTQHMTAEVVENNFDAIMFELPIMNDVGSKTSAVSVQDLVKSLTKIGHKDVMFYSPNPFGDNGAGTNYYPLYTAPSMEETSNALCRYMYKNAIPFVNCFEMFKRKIENRGGTLAGGQGGLYYTTDGQHPSVAGAREWFGLLKPYISNKPIS